VFTLPPVLAVPLDRWIAWTLFALVMAITPGPNNVMLMASGLRFGARRTVPHCLGVGLGFGAMFFAVEIGVGTVIATNPLLFTAMKWTSLAFLLWIAWGIASAAPEPDASSAGEPPAAGRARPLGFLGGAAFQWVNPKAWLICIGAVGTYVPAGTGYPLLAAMATVLAGVTVASGATWVAFGQWLRRMLRTPRRQRIFNLTMAVLLVASILPSV
jgi:threonine/homoserine/homoserine lactone efflux protein